ARLTDFGTAVIAGEDRLTATGMVFGSPAYMAPEQAVDVEVGPAADLWALGATLYQAVEGVPPFSGPTPVATMYAVMHDDPRPMERAGGLQHVIDRLLIRDADARAGGPEVRELLRAVAGQSTALLPAAAAGHRSPDARPRGDAPSGAEAAVAEPTSGGEAEGGWASSPVSRRRAGGPARTPVLLVAGVAALLIAAAVLAWIAGRDRGPTIPVADDATELPADGVEILPPVGPPTTVATPAPEETAVEPTPSPQEDEDDDERGNEGQGNQGQGDQGEGNQGDGRGNQEDGEGDDGPGGEAQPAVGALPAVPVPEDWVTYEPEEAPYLLAHPPDWTVERLDATRTDISDPGSAAYLRLDWTDDPAPDPVADWEAYEPQFAEGREGYERVRMEPTTFKGEPAALWEYRYARDGVTYHAYNLNVSGGGYGYALNFQTREEEWAALSPLFSAFAESYRLRG
ncbi:MAG TPA: hypothetical protein VMM13_02585, partial [Euzebya sp.]|nr:hypothetical protein [Euzebya sp.]